MTTPELPCASHADPIAALHSRIIAAARAAVEREFATADSAPPVDLNDHDMADVVADTVAELRAVITGGSQPDRDLAARTAVLVTTHVALRDGVLRLALGHEHAAARVFTRVAAHHRGRVRGEMLAMAALAYYAAEDTTRADIALRFAAEAVDQDTTQLPRLAEITAAALRHGLPPERVRRVLESRDATPLPGTDR